MRSSLLSFFFAIAGLVVACGGADGASAPAAKSPAEASPRPTTIEDAQAEIARASAELSGRNGEAKKSEPPAAPPPPPPPASAPGPSGGGAESKPSPAAECQSPCRAIASMRRAVETLCHLTGGDDARCVDAKNTLRDSEARVLRCGC